jgi:hypothetical protein
MLYSYDCETLLSIIALSILVYLLEETNISLGYILGPLEPVGLRLVSCCGLLGALSLKCEHCC